jgi:hypothetical protein
VLGAAALPGIVASPTLAEGDFFKEIEPEPLQVPSSRVTEAPGVPCGNLPVLMAFSRRVDADFFEEIEPEPSKVP